MRPAIERAMRRVNVDQGSGCWNWTGAKTKGYGQIKVSGKVQAAHRVVMLHFREKDLGPILDHLCGNKGCVNPYHLEAVSNAENLRRAAEKRTHCRRGHEIGPENTYYRKDGYRVCRPCWKLKFAEWKSRQ